MARFASSLVLGNPRNAGLRRHFHGRHGGRALPAVAAPQAVRDPYYTLGTHPDLVARLWDELGGTLPTDCRVVFCGTPALAHPQTGTVFGFAGGTQTYALRLPEPQREDAIRRGAGRTKHYPSGRSLDLAAFGPEWVFCGWFDEERAWCLAAYELAGAT